MSTARPRYRGSSLHRWARCVGQLLAPGIITSGESRLMRRGTCTSCSRDGVYIQSHAVPLCGRCFRRRKPSKPSRPCRDCGRPPAGKGGLCRRCRPRYPDFVSTHGRTPEEQADIAQRLRVYEERAAAEQPLFD